MEGLLLVLLIVLMVFIIGFTIIYLLNYVGYFYKVHVTAGPSIVSEMRVAYKLRKGSYSACEPYFTELTQLCPKLRTMGIYYDDPKKVDSDACRYIVGAILKEGTKQSADLDLQSKMEEHGYKVIDFPKVDFSVKTSHPFRVTLSASFGAMKAYPAMEEYIKKEKLCAHPFLEIYDDDTIHYMAPLSKQSDFYVEEVRGMLKGE